MFVKSDALAATNFHSIELRWPTINYVLIGMQWIIENGMVFVSTVQLQLEINLVQWSSEKESFLWTTEMR